MPWRKGDYPPSLKNFDTRVRDKAVEIANALLRDGYDEGRAIAIATSQAKEWDEHHPEPGLEREPPRSRHGAKRATLHVVPAEGDWAVKWAGDDEPIDVSASKAEAIKRARLIAEEQEARTVIHRRNGTIERSVNP